jgi:hypothetical protein
MAEIATPHKEMVTNFFFINSINFAIPFFQRHCILLYLSQLKNTSNTIAVIQAFSLPVMLQSPSSNRRGALIKKDVYTTRSTLNSLPGVDFNLINILIKE